MGKFADKKQEAYKEMSVERELREKEYMEALDKD